ncbi:MAG: L-fuculose-phosphate aldolase [Cryptosporangiaceae bacterium]|nr:L-fuculose-phosphate aldolase [Cryptosporangiaceae bacterium]
MLAEARDAIVVSGRRMLWDRLVVGTAGNLSVREGDLVAVTPTGIPYDALTAGSVGVHDLSGSAVEAPLAPTSELPLHLAVYAATDARAIVHTHSVAATALSCLVDEVPAVHYYAAMFGGPPRVAPYAEYGSASLAAGAVAALDGRSACLLGNHGAVTVGHSLAEAYDRALYLEWLCEVALRVLSSGSPPRLLTPAQLTAITPRLTTYGQP